MKKRFFYARHNDKSLTSLNNFIKTCNNCQFSKIEYGLRSGFPYLYCKREVESVWDRGKEVTLNNTCMKWRHGETKCPED